MIEHLYPWVAPTWEKALAVLMKKKNHRLIKHEDKDEPPFIEYIEPMVIHIPSPMGLYRYHKYMLSYCLPTDLMDYIAEVCDGTKDHFIDMDDPSKWHYTYHERLTSYKCAEKILGPVTYTLPDIFPGGSRLVEYEDLNLDQLNIISTKLAEHPTSRRAQAITWKPGYDTNEKFPPCLQRIWCTIRDNKLEMHTHWRSREAFLAAYMNIIAFTELHKRLADKLGVEQGSYFDITDSYHLRSTNIETANKFLGLVRKGNTLDRFIGEKEFQESLKAQMDLKEYK